MGGTAPGAEGLPWNLLTSLFQGAVAGEADAAEVGPWREHHEKLKELQRAVARYGQLATEMGRRLAEVHAETLDLLRRRLEQRSAGSEPAAGTAQAPLEDLWIECGEEIYGRAARTESYVLLQAELGNAAAEVKSLQQALLEQWLKSHDLPTRSEMNTLIRRVQDLRREVAALRGAAPAAGRAKKTGGATDASSKPAGRKAVRRKGTRPGAGALR